MDIKEFVNIDKKSDEKIKELFNLLLWEAIEQTSNDLHEDAPTEFNNDLCGKAQTYWQQCIQNSYENIVEEAVTDHKYEKEAKLLKHWAHDEEELIHLLWELDFMTYEEGGEVHPLPKFSVRTYLEDIGGTEEEIKKIFKIIEREE